MTSVVRGSATTDAGARGVRTGSGGWQHEASSRVDRQHREEVLFERLLPRNQAWVQSQSGPGGSLVLTRAPSVLTKIPPHLFRVTRLAPTALRWGHWGGGDSHFRVLRRVFVGRQGVTTNVMVRVLDLPLNTTNSRRKWLWTGCRCSAGHSWQWIRRWCVPFLHCDSHGIADTDGVIFPRVR